MTDQHPLDGTCIPCVVIGLTVLALACAPAAYSLYRTWKTERNR